MSLTPQETGRDPAAVGPPLSAEREREVTDILTRHRREEAENPDREPSPDTGPPSPR